MKNQFAKTYDGITSNRVVKKINDDIEANKNLYHIVAMTKFGIDDGVIVIWESNEDTPAK